VSVVQAYAHLPYVAVEGERVPIAGGELVRLDFDAWTSLDSSFRFADRAYERSRPTFFHVDFDYGDEPGSLEDAIGAMSSLTRRLYTALVLVTAERLPSPAFSVAYHRDAETGAYATTIGPFEREVLLYAADQRLELDEDELGRVASAAAFLAEHDDLVELPEVAAALATLERTARPEVTPLSGLVLEVGAFEALLLPEARTHLTATFARRVSALLTADGDDLRLLHKRARGWYRARSEAVHGGGLERVAESAGQEPDVFLFEVRRGLVASLGAALGRLAEHPEGGLERLRAALDARWEQAA
jgi:hypothetical protein